MGALNCLSTSNPAQMLLEANVVVHEQVLSCCDSESIAIVGSDKKLHSRSTSRRNSDDGDCGDGGDGGGDGDDSVRNRIESSQRSYGANFASSCV